MKLVELLTEGYKEVTQKFAQEADPEQVNQVIATFKDLVQRNQITGNERNIDWWGKQGWEKFSSYVNTIASTKSKTQISKRKDTGSGHILHEDNDWLILVPLDRAASCFHGKHSDWCTSKPDNESFEAYFYHHDVMLIYFIQKKTGNMWGMGVHSPHLGYIPEIFDIDNKNITIEQFEQDTGLDAQMFIDMVKADTPAYDVAMGKRKEYQSLVNDVTERIKNHNESGIQERDNTIEKLLLTINSADINALYINPFMERFIGSDSPNDETVEQLLTSLRCAPLVEKYVKELISRNGDTEVNPKIQNQLANMSGRASMFQNITNPTTVAANRLVKHNPNNVGYLQNPPVEILQMATKMGHKKRDKLDLSLSLIIAELLSTDATKASNFYDWLSTTYEDGDKMIQRIARMKPGVLPEGY
jgi:hypothetical protein